MRFVHFVMIDPSQHLTAPGKQAIAVRNEGQVQDQSPRGRFACSYPCSWSKPLSATKAHPQISRQGIGR